jgi:hypothetical protein
MCPTELSACIHKSRFLLTIEMQGISRIWKELSGLMAPPCLELPSSICAVEIFNSEDFRWRMAVKIRAVEINNHTAVLVEL